MNDEYYFYLSWIQIFLFHNKIHLRLYQNSIQSNSSTPLIIIMSKYNF